MKWDWERAIKRWGIWESIHPGGGTGIERIDCPYCGTKLEVEVIHRWGSDEYICGECEGEFEVNWRDGSIWYYTADDSE